MSINRMRITLKLAGVYNVIWGGIAILFPIQSFKILGMPPPIYPQLWQCIGMIVGVYGLGYWIVDSVGKPLIETNLYGYTSNDPINFIDPDGESRIAVTVIRILNRIGPPIERFVRRIPILVKQGGEKINAFICKTSNKFFGKGGLLNSNRYLRIGFSKKGGRKVFRIGGDILKNLGIKKGKIDLIDLGPL
ncbi:MULTISPECIES: hypothetical protein [unclassified Nitrospina]|uniref:hypothetical protein n=1 Tax=unclassified Nitrospina TaxID=2638683 RepID=UPI003F987C40